MPPNPRLQRRCQQIEKLPAKNKRQLLQLIDTFVKVAQRRLEGSRRTAVDDARGKAEQLTGKKKARRVTRDP